MLLNDPSMPIFHPWERLFFKILHPRVNSRHWRVPAPLSSVMTKQNQCTKTVFWKTYGIMYDYNVKRFKHACIGSMETYYTILHVLMWHPLRCKFGGPCGGIAAQLLSACSQIFQFSTSFLRSSWGVPSNILVVSRRSAAESVGATVKLTLDNTGSRTLLCIIRGQKWIIHFLLGVRPPPLGVAGMLSLYNMAWFGW